MAFTAPSGTNVFVPPSIAQELTIDFARSPSTFALNRWAQRKVVKHRRGYYLRINPAENARVLNADARGNLWPPKSVRPSRPDNTKLHENVPYETRRYSEGYVIDDIEREQSDHDLTKSYARGAMQRVMTTITQQVVTDLAAADFSGNTDTATSLGGGFLHAGTATAPYLATAILAARIEIEKRTMGMIRGDELVLLMSPVAAKKLSLSQEIYAPRQQSPYVLPLITGEKSNFNTYGLPPKLYDHDVVVENTVKVTSRKGAATEAADYVLDSNAVYLVSRPGGIEGTDGTTAHSTVTVFTYAGEGKDYDGADFSIEEFYDPKNRLTEGYVTWDIDPQVTTTRSAYKITAAFS